MSSLVDYGDSDEELPSGEQCRRKRFENFADLPRPPKVARVREATPPSIDNSSSIHDEHVDLEASEECFQEVDHKKGNLKNIQLSADSISILHVSNENSDIDAVQTNNWPLLSGKRQKIVNIQRKG